MIPCIGDLLARSVRLDPDAPAIQDEDRTVSFVELAREVRRTAEALVGLGVRSGDRLAILSRNRIEYAALYFAAAEVGAVLVPLNWRLGAREVHQILKDSDARILFAERRFVVPLEGQLRGVLLDGSAPGWTPWRDLPGGSLPPGGLEEERDAVQMYTSGTTGHPKGVLLTQSNLCWNTLIWLREMPFQPTSRYLQVTPLFHIGGLVMLLCAVAAGATIVLHREFAPDLVGRALDEDGITHTLMVPAMLRWLLMEPSNQARRAPHLERVLYGGSPIGVDLLGEAMAHLECDFVQGYGLTETCAGITALRPEDHRDVARLQSAGRAVQLLDVRVVDGDGAPCPVGTAGEIVCRGPNVTRGYWRRPDETASALRGGWFHTGDVGTKDDGGYLYIVDRLKDLIIVGGENVSSREVEAVLLARSEVADAAVVGIPHPVWGESVLAYVQSHVEGSVALERALIRACRRDLAQFKCPTRIEFRTELPRNAAGKVLKAELRAPWWSEQERKV